jgi:hypothetical protein
MIADPLGPGEGGQPLPPLLTPDAQVDLGTVEGATGCSAGLS